MVLNSHPCLTPLPLPLAPVPPDNVPLHPRSVVMANTPRPLAEYFAELRDPRVQRKCEHDFLSVILIVVCATLAGADDFVSMATFARAKQAWFRDRLGLNLDNGIPSHDTLNRIFAAIRPDEFGRCFLGWVESLS